MTEYVIQIQKNNKWISAKKLSDRTASIKAAEAFSQQSRNTPIRVLEGYITVDGTQTRWRPIQSFNLDRESKIRTSNTTSTDERTKPNRNIIAKQYPPTTHDHFDVDLNERDMHISELAEGADPTLLYIIKYIFSATIYPIFWFRRTTANLNKVFGDTLYPKSIRELGTYLMAAFSASLIGCNVFDVSRWPVQVTAVVLLVLERYITGRGLNAMRQYNELFSKPIVTRSSKLWSYALGAVYLNYKINCFCDEYSRVRKAKELLAGTISRKAHTGSEQTENSQSRTDPRNQVAAQSGKRLYTQDGDADSRASIAIQRNRKTDTSGTRIYSATAIVVIFVVAVIAIVFIYTVTSKILNPVDL